MTLADHFKNTNNQELYIFHNNQIYPKKYIFNTTQNQFSCPDTILKFDNPLIQRVLFSKHVVHYKIMLDIDRYC